MISWEDKLAVVRGARRYGGAFAQALGEALMCADVENTQKIKKTWPEFWKQYLRMGNNK